MTGRPRDPGLEQRLLSAAWSLLTSEGYEALTMRQVAVQAKAHRTDLYRRWPSKARLVTDVLAAHLPPVQEVDTGSLLSDLRAYVGDLAESWSAPWIDGLVGLLADLPRDPDAALAFHKMGERRGRPAADAIARAVRRSELDEVPDLHLIGALLEGPLMHGRMFGRRTPTPEYLDAVALAAYRMLTEAQAGAQAQAEVAK